MFLSDVLAEIKKLDANKNPVPINIEIRTHNKYNKTGGRYIGYYGAELLQPPPKKGLKRLADPTEFKNPNHFKNRTRNIKINGEIVKINILFIIRFNGHLVVY